MIIGITGGSGGGKSTVSRELEKIGFKIIDADKVAHNVMKKGSLCLDEVIKNFSAEYLDANGEIDRKKLGKLVFNSPEKLELLNSITHKYIIKEIENEIVENTVIEAIGLFDTSLYKMCDSTVFVYCPEETRIERIMKREGVSRDYAESRVKAQKSDEYFKNKADFVLINDGEKNISEQLKGFYGEKLI